MIFSARAQRDIEDALAYHAAPSAPAARFAAEMQRALDMLDRFPGILLRKTLFSDKDLYFWPVRPFWLVVRKGKSSLELVAVVHAARDMRHLL